MNHDELSGIRKNPFDRTNAVIAGLVFFIAFIIYVKTKAPTFSFWDCGEFVACSYILGIPHPPGSPLYILVGRIFSILPIAGDIAARINMLSVVTSAAAAVFGYLVTVRLIRFWFGDRSNIQNRIITYIGGFTGALFMAFSSTNWSNSIEAEVYAPAILLMLIIYWLVLKYFDSKEDPAGSRFMLLLAYLAMLGVGIHLTLFVIVPLLALFFILKKEAGTREWAVVSLFFFAELYLIYQLSSRPGEVPVYMPVLILFIILLFHAILMNKVSRPVLISIGLFLISLYPLYFVVIETISRNLSGVGLSEGVKNLSSIPVGWFGLAGLTLWGIYSITRHLILKGKSDDADVWLLTAVYSLAPVILFGIGQFFRGYEAFLAVSVVAIAIVALTLWRQINWLILFGFGAISMVILGFWYLVWGVVIGSAAILIAAVLLKDRNWKTAISIILLAVLGYSIHAFIPIRSAHNPSIDENNPSRSFAAVVGYLERKQYGAQSMTERMFVRRAEWGNQFGDYRRMGFWRFFKDQYGFRGARFFIVLILGLFGLWETIRRKPDIGLPFLVAVIVCSVGIVLYMNFADGTRQHPVTGADYIEVRERDYFFTPAFVCFGLAIGLGIAAFMDLIRDTFSNFGPAVRKGAFGASTVLVLMPLFPLTVNYFYNDRSRNYMPYDYASNYLASCPPNSIFITNGDNDTFSVWCIQEVYGVRPDVKVINLSLANTKWYIRQLRDNLNVPINLTEEQIDRLMPYRDQEGIPHRIQDQLVDHVITANNWKHPITFAVTVPEENRRFRGKSMEDHLILEGMVNRMTQEKGENQVDFELTRKLYEEEFEYRGVSDPTIYKNETTSRLTGNYAQGFLILADSLRRGGDFEGALEFIRKGLEIVPESEEVHTYAAQLFGRMGRLDTLQIFIENAPVREKHGLYFNWGLSAKHAGRIDEAIEVLEMMYRLYPDYTEGYQALVTTYYQNKRYNKLRQIVTGWVARHPEDHESRELLRQIESIDAARDTLEGIG